MKTDFELMQEKAEDLGIDAHKWYGHEDQTQESTMHDSGTGSPVVIRLFEFKLPPTLEHLPTKEQILTPEYLKHLKVQLWGDSLRLVMEPRVIIDKESIKVFAPCEAASGSNFLEEPKTIQEWVR